MEFVGKVVKEEIEIEDYLKERNVKYYKLIAGDLDVYKIVSYGYTGGKNYEVWEYLAPSDGRRVLMCATKIGYADMVNTEIIVFNLEKDEPIDWEILKDEIREVHEKNKS